MTSVEVLEDSVALRGLAGQHVVVSEARSCLLANVRLCDVSQHRESRWSGGLQCARYNCNCRVQDSVKLLTVTARRPDRRTVPCSGIHESEGRSAKAACASKLPDEVHSRLRFLTNPFQMFFVRQAAIQSDSNIFRDWLTTEGDI